MRSLQQKKNDRNHHDSEFQTGSFQSAKQRRNHFTDNVKTELNLTKMKIKILTLSHH